MSHVTGNTLVTCKTRRGFNRQSGTYTEYIYEGPRESIYGMIGDLGTADDWMIDHDGPKHTLKVRYSNDQSENTVETPVNEFRLHANRVTISIFNHPNFSTLSSEDKQFCKMVAAGETVPADLVAAVAVDFTNVAVAEGGDTEREALMKELIRTLRDGVEHFVVNQPVIIRSRVASSEFNYTSLDGPYDDVGSIISPDNIFSHAGLANILKTVLPTGGSDGIYVYGWLKHYPEYTEAAGNKGLFTQEFEWGRWRISIYGNAI